MSLSSNAPVPTTAFVSSPGASRVDLLAIADMVEANSRVLDIGCGEGELLQLLADTKNVDARGMELSQRGVNDCVAKGLSVIQGDADIDLVEYPDDGFDYVILSQTIQATRHPRKVLENMLRIGRRVIVSFPNFGHWKIRLQLLATGRMPVTKNLAYTWYETPNIHFCTINDFIALVDDMGAVIEQASALDRFGRPVEMSLPRAMWNLFGEQAVFVLSGK